MTDPPAEIMSLRRIILERAAKEGRLSFCDFMREALHHSQWGYYRSRQTLLGARGDFSTCQTIHPVLGKSLAAWIGDVIRHRRWSGPFSIIECGAGCGELASTILLNLEKSVQRNVRYHILESHPDLRARQRQLLTEFPIVSWHENMNSALRDSSRQTIILANEFVDTFPVRIFQWQNGTWQEVFLMALQDTLVEKLDEPDPALIGSDDYGFLKKIPPLDSQRVESHITFKEWWMEWNDQTGDETMFTIIDYGDTFPGLYDRKPAGSIRAYWNHRCLSGQDVYIRPGQQDLTADINFSDLKNWAIDLGWTTLDMSTQRDFILKYGGTRTIFGRKPFVPTTHAEDFVTHPRGAGQHFKVLTLMKKTQ